MIKTLQSIQDILGSIRDYDVTIDYLKKLEPSKEIQEIINNEMEQRRLKYEEFLRFCKRCLHISRDSFFARIKNLLSEISKRFLYVGSKIIISYIVDKKVDSDLFFICNFFQVRWIIIWDIVIKSFINR